MGAGASIGGGVAARDSAISTSSAQEVTFPSASGFSEVSSEAWRKEGEGSAEPSRREMTESAAVGRAEEVVVSGTGAGAAASTLGAAGAEVRPSMSSLMRATTAGVSVRSQLYETGRTHS